MSTLHMDTDSCQSAKSQLDAAKEQITTEITQLKSLVDSMVGSTWIAPAANQYQEQFNQWHTNMNTQLENLASLSASLQTEINQWIETANAVSGGTA